MRHQLILLLLCTPIVLAQNLRSFFGSSQTETKSLSSVDDDVNPTSGKQIISRHLWELLPESLQVIYEYPTTTTTTTTTTSTTTTTTPPTTTTTTPTPPAQPLPFQPTFGVVPRPLYDSNGQPLAPQLQWSPNQGPAPSRLNPVDVGSQLKLNPQQNQWPDWQPNPLNFNQKPPQQLNENNGIQGRGAPTLWGWVVNPELAASGRTDNINKTTQHSSTNITATVCPNEQYTPCVTSQQADARYKHCCSHLGPRCTRLCTHSLTHRMMHESVLAGECSIVHLPTIMRCGSRDSDVTECCRRRGVFDYGRDFCTPFCNPSEGLPSSPDPKYRLCLDLMPTIQSCFHAYQN